MNNNISVLIADDNEDLAKELSSYIGAKPNMTVTAIATDGEEETTLIDLQFRSNDDNRTS